MTVNVYDIVRDRLLKTMDENKEVPWKKFWNIKGSLLNPINIVSGKNYRGINILLLGMAPSPIFGTYKQWSEMGCTIKKGRHAYVCIFYTKVNRTEEQEKKTGYTGHMPRNYALLRYYNVFCAEDVELSDVAKAKIEKMQSDRTPTGFEERSDYFRIAVEVIDRTGVQVCYGNPACYKGRDLVTMPDFKDYHGPNAEFEYLTSVCHELVHWTGHKQQLDRSVDNSYAYEELVAEIGATFLVNALGIEITDAQMVNNAAYVNNWYHKLSTDSKCINTIMKASSDAQKACDFILGCMKVENFDGDGDEE